MSNSKIFQPSDRTVGLKQSGIRSASQRCQQISGINLGQGVCDIPIMPVIKEAAAASINNDKSLYSACEGIYPLREKIAEKMLAFNNLKVDPATQVMVSHGATGAYVSAVNTLFNPGDEVILFEPFYGYHKDLLELFGCTIKTVPINMTDFSFSMDDVRAAISNKTKAIVVCTPNNPTGKIFSREELLAIGEVAIDNDLYILTDEMYEYITYPGYEHVSLASLSDDLFARTITISGFSKTYNMTGWRLGYAVGPAAIIEKMALVQDLIYVCPSTPLQYASLAAYTLADDYYTAMRDEYLKKRDLTVQVLEKLGFNVTCPQGAYYIMANFANLPFADDETATNFLLEKAKVATVTGRSFFQNPVDGKQFLRICYALDESKVSQALTQLEIAMSDI